MSGEIDFYMDDELVYTRTYHRPSARQSIIADFKRKYGSTRVKRYYIIKPTLNDRIIDDIYEKRGLKGLIKRNSRQEFKDQVVNETVEYLTR